MIRENWRSVVGYEGLYEVSDQGRVRGIDRYVTTRGGVRLSRGQILRPTPIVKGSKGRAYHFVNLSRSSKKARFSVHRLVLTAFVGPCPDGMEGCHNNGDASDNRIANLRWDTRANNGADKRRHKTHCVRGHEYTPENTRLDRRSKGRSCKKCDNAASVIRTRARRAAQRAQKGAAA
ncbi:MAG: NUMOD4 motif-containing HNH endonuclease [Mycobacterium sp.]